MTSAPCGGRGCSHYCTNWCGDDGWLFRVRGEFRKFNYMGDTTWITAVVTDKRIDADLGALVDIEVTGTNQRGQQNINGWATILVASRERGPVRLPEPPETPAHLLGHGDTWCVSRAELSWCRNDGGCTMTTSADRVESADGALADDPGADRRLVRALRRPRGARRRRCAAELRRVRRAHRRGRPGPHGVGHRARATASPSGRPTCGSGRSPRSAATRPARMLVPINTRFKGREAGVRAAAGRRPASCSRSPTSSTPTTSSLLREAEDDLPDLEQIVVLRGPVPEGCISLDEFLARGVEVDDAARAARPASVDRRRPVPHHVHVGHHGRAQGRDARCTRRSARRTSRGPTCVGPARRRPLPRHQPVLPLVRAQLGHPRRAS